MARVLKNKFLDIRLKKGYKIAGNFAKTINIGQSQYSRYENQEVQPSLKKALEICEELNMSVEDVFYLDEK